MQTINLNLDLATMTPNQLTALSAFVLAFAPGSQTIGFTTDVPVVKLEPTPAATEETAPPKKKRATKETFVDTEAAERAAKEAQKEADEAAAIAANGPAEESTVKLEDLRALLGEKIGDHREAIRAKFTELDAKNVSVMKPEDYQEFYNFLASLK